MQGTRKLEVLMMEAEDLRSVTVNLFKGVQSLQKELIQTGMQYKRETAEKEKNILGLQKMTKRFEDQLQ